MSELEISNRGRYQGIRTTAITSNIDLERRLAFREKCYLELINADQEACRKMTFVNVNRRLALPWRRHEELNRYSEAQEAKPSTSKYLVFGIKCISLFTDNILSHPFIVLRRQSQVYGNSECYHIHPFTLWPSILQLQRRQGVVTLWKGWCSCLLMHGITFSVDKVIFKCTIDSDNRISLKRFGQHVLLKCISIGLLLPFQAGTLIETVESNLVSKKPGRFNVFHEGSLRLLNWSYPQYHRRLLPAFKAMIAPTVAIGISKHLFYLAICGICLSIMQRRLKRAPKKRMNSSEQQNAEISSNFIAMVITEVIFYPLETILHRLQLQDAVSIIDNLDTGSTIVPILTYYRGTMDCFRCTIISEGYLGLFKGFSAMMLQFVVQMAVVKVTKWIVGYLIKGRQFRNHNLDCVSRNSNSLTPISSSTEL